MSINEKIKGKFEKLLEEGKRVFQECRWDGNTWHRYPSDVDYLRFRTESLNLIRKVCGEDSEHYQQLRRLAEDKQASQNSYYYHQCYGVLEAASRDFSEDFLFDVRVLVRAELLGGFIEQAETLLNEGYYIPAASLAGAVLEDALRKMCDQENIAYQEKSNIDALNSLLAKADVYNKLVQKEVTAKADIRNNADHGKFDQFRESDVKDMVRWVQRFCSEHLK